MSCTGETLRPTEISAVPSFLISNSNKTQLASLGSSVLTIAWLSSAGFEGTVPSSIRGVSRTPIWETLTNILIQLLSTPEVSSFNSETSESESNLSSNSCMPVVENECGKETESSSPPAKEALTELCMVVPAVRSLTSIE